MSASPKLTKRIGSKTGKPSGNSHDRRKTRRELARALGPGGRGEHDTTRI